MPTYGQQCPGQIDCIDPFCSLVPGLINCLLASVQFQRYDRPRAPVARVSYIEVCSRRIAM